MKIKQLLNILKVTIYREIWSKASLFIEHVSSWIRVFLFIFIQLLNRGIYEQGSQILLHKRSIYTNPLLGEYK